MKTKKRTIVVLVALTFPFVVANIGLGQDKGKCGPIPDGDSPSYRVGQKYYTAPSYPKRTFVVYISVEAGDLNRSSMTKLAARLKHDFCIEPRIQAVIFDNYKAARRFVPNSESKTYRVDMSSMKGGYFLDRAAHQEYISFSVLGKGAADEEKIDLTHM